LILTFSASGEKLELYRKRCELISDVYEKLSNAAHINDAKRANLWDEWTCPIFVHTELFERTHGKYVPTPPSGARRSGYVPSDSRCVSSKEQNILDRQRSRARASTSQKNGAIMERLLKMVGCLYRKLCRRRKWLKVMLS
jgi:hypothetical protein